VNEDLHSLAGAYALDALPDNERARFEQHLAGCGDCAQEVRGLRETASHLGSAVAIAAPPRLRAQTLARISDVRQLPPAVADLGAERERRARRRPRFGFTLAAACLIVALISGVFAIRSQQELNRTRAANVAVASVLSSPDARTVTGTAQTGGTATVVVSRSSGRIVFASSGLKRLPRSQTYELWLMTSRSARPAGLVRPGDDGRTRPVVAGDLGDATQVGVTVEPAAGSPQPTADPVLVLTLPA
jgi:anti-sigma-K factor RskA